MTVLHTARLCLRPPRLEDVDALLALDPATTRPRLTQEILVAEALDGGALWVMERDGLPVGRCVLHHRIPGEREIGWLVTPALRGRGFATEAASTLRDHAFRHLGVHRLVARIRPGNEASAVVARRLGMRREGSEDGLELWTVDRN